MGMGLGLQATLIQFVLLTPSLLFLRYCARLTTLYRLARLREQVTEVDGRLVRCFTTVEGMRWTLDLIRGGLRSREKSVWY